MTSAGSPSATSAPLCSTMMRSASSRTTSILCSTSRMVSVASRLQLADQVQHHRHLVDAHAGGRLVEHEDLRLQRHQQRHFQLALVAVRQAGHQLASRLSASRTAARICVGLVDQLARGRSRCASRFSPSPACRGPARVPARPAARSPARVRLGNRLVSWKARPEAGARALRGADRPVRSRAVQQHRALAGRQLAGDQVEVGGLAGAVGADDGRQRARLEAARHAVDRHVAAEADRSDPGSRACVVRIAACASGAGADHVVVGPGLLQRRRDVGVPQAHVLVRPVGIACSHRLL